MKYSKAQISYHWLSFAVLIAMAVSGLAYTYDWLGSGSMGFHQIAGQIFIIVLIARIIARLMRPVVIDANHPASWEDLSAKLVHGGLYLCMIAYVVTGYIAASGLNDPLLAAPVSQAFARSDTGELMLEAHFMLKWVLLGLVTLHIAAALKHRFWNKDNTFSHMTLTFRKD